MADDVIVYNAVTMMHYGWLVLVEVVVNDLRGLQALMPCLSVTLFPKAPARLSAVLAVLRLCRAQLAEHITPNRIWKEDAPIDSGSLAASTEFVCDRVPSRQPSIIQRGLEYSVPDLAGAPPGGSGSLADILHGLRQEQVGSAFSQTQLRCGSSPLESAEVSECEQAWADYIMSLVVPYGIPLFLSALLFLLWFPCCFVACCRCCRQMVCCKEGKEPTKTSRFCIIIGVVLWSGASAFQVALCSSMVEASQTLHDSVNWSLCIAHHFAAEVLHGSTWFLGTEPALRRFNSVGVALDADSVASKTLGSVMANSEDFSRKHDMLLRRLQHISSNLEVVGLGRRLFDHRCVFCNLALGVGEGAASSLPLGYPSVGLLRALEHQIAASSSQATATIRQIAATHLTKQNLTDLAQSMKYANISFSLFNEAVVKEAVAKLWVKNRPHIDTVESIRHLLFVSVSVLAGLGAIIGWAAFLRTRYKYAKMGEDPHSRPPSGRLHLVSWCCAFLHTFLALTLGSSLFILTVPVAETCVFVRSELLTFEGLERYASVFGVFLTDEDTNEARAAREAVRLAQTCLSRNRTGDMLTAIGLGGSKLDFQSELAESFYQLDDKLAEPPLGVQSADLVQRLIDAAEDFGGTFLLDPVEPDNATESYGRLELASNVEGLLLNSGLAADDQIAPDSVTTIRGLNTYAELIAGPGQYTFLSGTSGGGFVISPTRPSESELESLPTDVGNALRYAQNKEKLLAADALQCNVMSDDGSIHFRACGVHEFHDHVIAEASLLKAALAETTAMADAVQILFARDLKSELLPTLTSLRSLRSLLNCAAMWQRVEELDTSFCDDIANTISRGAAQSMAQALAAFVGLVVQYKIWRRLKDNKTLQDELGRYEKKLQQHMRQLMQFDAAPQDGQCQRTAHRADTATAKVRMAIALPRGYSGASLHTPRSIAPQISATSVALRRQPSLFTPRDRGPHPSVVNTWANHPARSSSAPRICLSNVRPMAVLPREEGSVSAPVYAPAVPAGATILPVVSAAPLVRHVPGSRNGQFIRCDQEVHRVLDQAAPAAAVEGLEATGNNFVSNEFSQDAKCAETSALGRFQQALAEQRAEHEAKLVQLQAHWEERFAEAVSFWQKAWSTTTAAVKDCNTHCVKLSEVLEASLDELGQNSMEATSLTCRLQVLEEAVGLPQRRSELAASQEDNEVAPETLPRTRIRLEGLSGTSDSFKRLSNELARFEHEVSAHSQKLLSVSHVTLTTDDCLPAHCQTDSFADRRSLNAIKQAPSVGPAYKPKSQTTAGALPPADCLQASKDDRVQPRAGLLPRAAVGGIPAATEVSQVQVPSDQRHDALTGRT
eukprot:s2355_g11.t2